MKKTAAAASAGGKHKGLNFEFLQKLGKALMVVIAVMPAAGLMISLGNIIQIFGADVAMLVRVGTIVANIGWGVINNLNLLFAVAIGGSWAKERAGGAFAAVIAFVLINLLTGSIFGVTADMLNTEGAVTTTLFGQEIEVADYFTSILGAPALNMGVFIGIIAGFWRLDRSMIQIKNAAELEKMRKACAISAAALKAGGEAIEPGITTAEIDKIIYDFIVRHGARPNFLHLYGFPATACISVNDTVIHGIPNHQQQIRPGDIVSIDTGCKIDGFNGDNACTYGCGKLDLEAQRLLDVTKESLHRGIAMACGGNRIGDISHAVQAYVEENGFSVVRSFVGHGVGKELHEDPEVPNYGNAGRGPRLVPGMCIAIEPMVCQYKYAVKTLKDGWTVKTCDGGLAAHFEHTVAITAGGAEILTQGWEEPGWTL